MEFDGYVTAAVSADTATLSDLLAALKGVGVSAEAFTAAGADESSPLCAGAGATAADDAVLMILEPRGDLVLPLVRAVAATTGGTPSFSVGHSTSLDGISAAWGTFQVELNGDISEPIPVGASAGEFKSILEGIDYIGEV